MARRKIGRRRGRPRLANAKRRTTTRIGRRTGQDPIDTGTVELRQRKRVLTGREDLPLDPAGVLYGRELIDAQQYSSLSLITEWLQRVAKAWGGKDASVNGLWSALLAA